MLLADDHALMRGGIRLLLESDPDIDVVGEAEDGLVAVALTEELDPDVMVMDISMPRINGIAAAEQKQSGEMAIEPSCCPTCFGGETVPLELAETNA